MPKQTAGSYLQLKDGDWTGLNRALRELYNRLDKLGGDRGVHAHQDDVLVSVAGKGFIVIDEQTTQHYWRIRVNVSGALITEDLGTTRPV